MRRVIVSIERVLPYASKTYFHQWSHARSRTYCAYALHRFSLSRLTCKEDA